MNQIKKIQQKHSRVFSGLPRGVPTFCERLLKGLEFIILFPSAMLP